MNWWSENKIRLVQNNLREIDVNMDVDAHINMLKKLGANANLVNCGGITALYPTKLPYQRTSPFLRKDWIAELIEKAHAQDIRILLRFDFSKPQAKLMETHPDWFTRNEKGECLIYEGTAGACVCGPWMQNCLFEILTEALNRYPADGVFFNAFGFGAWDYNGNRCDICHCDNCKKAFKEYSGYDLPEKSDPSDPVYIKYKQFQADKIADLMGRVIAHIKSLRPDALVSTYNTHADLIASESNSSVSRPLPHWMYGSVINAGSTIDTYEKKGKLPNNIVINAVDFLSRFMSVSPSMVESNLLGDMASGAPLAWCINGGFEDYPDKKAFANVERVFKFHEKHEDIYSDLRPDARILLVRGTPPEFMMGFTDEFQGIFKALVEGHYMFRTILEKELDRFADRLDEFDAVVLPQVELDPDSRFFKALEKSDVAVVATGMSMEKAAPEVLKRCFGVTLGEEMRPVRGHYLQTEPKSIFKRFPLTDRTYLDYRMRKLVYEPGTEGILPIVTTAPFGPPEFCYGHGVTDEMAVSIKNGRWAYVPFMLGKIYATQGYYEFRNMFLDILDKVVGKAPEITTDLPACAEVFMHGLEGGRKLIQIINLSGTNGITIEEPLPIFDKKLKLERVHVRRAWELTADGVKEIPLTDGAAISVDRVDMYKAYVVEE